jgi:transcriptional regulator with XRE-family HTH domain
MQKSVTIAKEKTNEQLLEEVERRVANDPKLRLEFESADLVRQLSNMFYSLRKEQGLTQQELAQRCFMTQPGIALLENPSLGREPTFSTLARVASGLGKRVVIGLADAQTGAVTWPEIPQKNQPSKKGMSFDLDWSPGPERDEPLSNA